MFAVFHLDQKLVLRTVGSATARILCLLPGSIILPAALGNEGQALPRAVVDDAENAEATPSMSWSDTKSSGQRLRCSCTSIGALVPIARACDRGGGELRASPREQEQLFVVHGQ